MSISQAAVTPGRWCRCARPLKNRLCIFICQCFSPLTFPQTPGNSWECRVAGERKRWQIKIYGLFLCVQELFSVSLFADSYTWLKQLHWRNWVTSWIALHEKFENLKWVFSYPFSPAQVFENFCCLLKSMSNVIPAEMTVFVVISYWFFVVL